MSTAPALTPGQSALHDALRCPEVGAGHHVEVKHPRDGWTFKSEFQLGAELATDKGPRVLRIRTAKAMSGALITTASVFVREPRFETHMLYEDYGVRLIVTPGKRATKGALHAQHVRALDHLPTIWNNATAHYAARSQGVAEDMPGYHLPPNSLVQVRKEPPSPAAILERLVAGYHPLTEKPLPNDSVCMEPAVNAALWFALGALDDLTIRQERRAALPRRSGKPWSRAEDDAVVNLTVGGASPAEIGFTLDRTAQAVRLRQKHLHAARAVSPGAIQKENSK